MSPTSGSSELRDRDLQIQRWQEEWSSRVGEERSVRVRWLLNPDDGPRPDVQLTEQQGTIVDLRPAPNNNRNNVLPLVLIPPLVNAHTHLEFSNIRTPLLPSSPFPDWIRAVMLWRQTNDTDDGITVGAQESYRAGVRILGDIATSNRSVSERDFPGTLISFREAIGLSDARISQQLDQIKLHLSQPAEKNRIRGISPHAPYTVHPDLLHSLIDLAVVHQAPVAMHLAETLEEIELLTTGRGPFAEFLNGLGLFNPAVFPGGRTVLDHLRELSRAPRALAVHGNYFTDVDISFLAEHPRIATVYCPRTHHYFGHSQHPFRKLMSAGCRVIVGTDSRASNPDLSIFRELQHIARVVPEIPMPTLIAMATTHAADSLGLDIEAFVIRSGGPFEAVALKFDPSLDSLTTIIQHDRTSAVKIG
jgi:cytosine/adenosine deaminase-related metal-dependent hydrolase